MCKQIHRWYSMYVCMYSNIHIYIYMIPKKHTYEFILVQIDRYISCRKQNIPCEEMTHISQHEMRCPALSPIMGRTTLGRQCKVRSHGLITNHKVEFHTYTDLRYSQRCIYIYINIYIQIQMFIWDIHIYIHICISLYIYAYVYLDKYLYV